jgi:GNAT superfamily N-acetyltransferase
MIRELKSQAEFDEAYELICHLHPKLSKADFLSRLELQRNANGYVLLGLYQNLNINNQEPTSRLVALAGYRLASSLSLGTYLYLGDLVTNHTCQGQGLGGKMLRHLELIAKDAGCSQIHLDAGVQRFDAHRFYARQGFNIVFHHFAKDIE